MRIDLHARAGLAISLIRRGMRTSIVGLVTGVHPVVLRELHHEIHRRKPASGQLPSSSGVLRSPLIQASASAFASLYRALAQADILTAVDNRAVVEAHDLYLEQVGDLASAGGQGVPIDINHAWIIARDLTTGVVRFQFCQRCRIHYVVADLANTPPICPLCALQRGCPSTRTGERRSRAAGVPTDVEGAPSSEGTETP
jgi:hypothetical protein